MKKAKNLLAIGIIVISLSGCMSFGATFGAAFEKDNPHFLEPMAGFRTWSACFNDPMMGGFAILLIPDLPFSFALDIALLPLTLPYSLVREFFGKTITSQENPDKL